jgi:hypothetical protein
MAGAEVASKVEAACARAGEAGLAGVRIRHPLLATRRHAPQPLLHCDQGAGS